MTARRDPASAVRTACLAPLLALLLGACSGASRAEFTPLSGTRYAPRPEPAAVTAEPAGTLPGKGYVLLGVVEARAPVRVCSEGGCIPARDIPDPTAAARRAAAGEGGDLIALELDAAVIREAVVWRGECLEWAGPMRNDDGFCARYEWTYRVREWALTRGTVWRRDPERALKGADKLARQLFPAAEVLPPKPEDDQGGSR